ncbi:glycoside hydrolase family 18 protein, partial [Macroventuria anomochaeta]
MRLSLFSALLALTAVGPSNGNSNLTFFGAPRASLDGVLSVLSIEEDYILRQTDSVSNTSFGAAGPLQCSASNPCADGSCCNSQGQCGFRDEHCKSNCVANCDATAPCGVNSKGGSRTCPLNVCCSYFGFCGASEAFCRDTTASGESTPCQKQFGKCGTVTTQSTPTCGKDSGTASRKVAYYEGCGNTRRRPCDKVWPANIDTAGLTHLIFSFATIDPTTFAVSPMHPDDEKLYADFLALKDGSKKWIGIGGWEFSDAGATRYTWSQMVSAKANRGAFIASLLRFLDKWKFQGVDIDWEWPGAESRGGNPAIDKQNQVDLTKELREALGSRGLSVVLPAQYEYLKNIDPKALEAQVDSFNVLAYDLHGLWDATIPGLGARVKPHTDLKEIATALDLFWFNDVNPSKINLGIANYGRGYTLEDASCARYDCPWTGPSNAGECTELAGVLSQCEIQRIIRQKNLKPEIIDGGAGVKQIVFDGQWVGYDDNETLGLKMELANNRCLGGTTLWAIDYASCGGGG